MIVLGLDGKTHLRKAALTGRVRLARSTAWTILQANHKSSGLSATVINRMLTAPQLPPLVRAIILEYIDEKVAGLYGHSKLQLRRFTARWAEQRRGDTRMKKAA